MIIGLLGILKAGGAYVPLDPSYPKERLSYVIEDAKVKLLLTQEKLLPTLPDLTTAAGEPPVQVFCLDRDAAELARRSKANPRNTAKNRVCPEHLAYCIYTSGSTGRPKG